jgi:hypothetical protein
MKNLKNLLGVWAIFAIIALAGTYDYVEEVIYTMPNATYKVMQQRGWSDKKIASEYQKDKAYWDSLGQQYSWIHGED